MKYRKLRIAWSVAWGIAAVLLVVLWVRTSTQVVRGQPPGRNVYMLMDITPLSTLLRLYTANEGLQLDTSGLPAETLATPITIKYEGDQQGWLEQLHGKTGLYFLIHNVAGRQTLAVTSQPNLTHRERFYGASVISIALAAAPWIRHLHFRFSLRTLLIATTLIAAVLGIIVWMSRAG
jgi:hypothetical protein